MENPMHPPMQPWEVMNLTIATIVLGLTIGLIVRAWFAQDEANHIIDRSSSSPRLLGAGWAFTLWSGWWLSLVLIYLFLDRPVNLWLLLAASDLGNLMVLGAAVAYCRADAFRIIDLIPLFLLIFLDPTFETATALLLPGAAGRVIAIAPSAIFSTVAMISIGWAVLVRCGWKSAPFFCMMCVYAVLQLPAFIYSFAFNQDLWPPLYDPTDPKYKDFIKIVPEIFGNLHYVFYVLAFMKIIIAISFIGYFVSPSHDSQALTKQLGWPAPGSIPMHQTYAKTLRWGAGLAGSAGVSFLLGTLLQSNLSKFMQDHVQRL